MSLVTSIKEHEGFRGLPYDDSLGIPTIGYGTKLPLSKAEADMLLRMRLHDFKEEIIKKFPWLKMKPSEIQEIVFEMAYQMGVPKLSKFVKTLAFIKAGEYQKASVEALDSVWARQTPKRAKDMSVRLLECSLS